MQEAIRQARTRMQAMHHEDEIAFWSDVEQKAYRTAVGGKTRMGMSILMSELHTKGVDALFREWQKARRWHTVEFKTHDSLIANENMVSILGTVHRVHDKIRHTYYTPLTSALCGVFDLVAHRLRASEVLDYWITQTKPSGHVGEWWILSAFDREFIDTSGDWKGASYGS
jgi:hypothetical protein